MTLVWSERALANHWFFWKIWVQLLPLPSSQALAELLNLQPQSLPSKAILRCLCTICDTHSKRCKWEPCRAWGFSQVWHFRIRTSDRGSTREWFTRKQSSAREQLVVLQTSWALGSRSCESHVAWWNLWAQVPFDLANYSEAWKKC